jgi:hypothetical protein
MKQGHGDDERQQGPLGQPQWIRLLLLIFWLVGCAGRVETTIPAAPVATDPALVASPAFITGDRVSLQAATVAWESYDYELTAEHSIVEGSYDGTHIRRHSFPAWILENGYLRVTLLPEYGGRILSIVYKPTGHEQLYQNPVGVPYQIGTGVFYYDWLMVYGGIFPTFPEPEHGKTWLLPWAFQVVSASDEEVTVAMSITDETDYPAAPGQYDLGATGLEVIYYVTLTAGRAALDTRIAIANRGEDDVRYEYWTNATLAPGSDPADPRTTAGAEIIAPVDAIKIPRYWTAIAAEEKATGWIDVYDFDTLRRFENWPDMGIAYAFPDMQGNNFWGVINHDNGEGLFRIADNTVTPGLKIWTWGYPQSSAVDPSASTDEARPYIELWAGVTREFWQRASLPAGSQLEIRETYSPSVGLANVTHANENVLVNLSHDGSSIDCQLFAAYPGETVQLSLLLDGQVFENRAVKLDPANSGDCSAELPAGSSGSTVELLITAEDDAPLFAGRLALGEDD